MCRKIDGCPAKYPLLTLQNKLKNNSKGPLLADEDIWSCPGISFACVSTNSARQLQIEVCPVRPCKMIPHF